MPAVVLVVVVVIGFAVVVTVLLARSFPRATAAVTATIAMGFAIAAKVVQDSWDFDDAADMVAAALRLAAYFFLILAVVCVLVGLSRGPKKTPPAGGDTGEQDVSPRQDQRTSLRQDVEAPDVAPRRRSSETPLSSRSRQGHRLQ